jgi:hypothetical protein
MARAAVRQGHGRAASAGLSSCGLGSGTGCQVEPFELLAFNGDLMLPLSKVVLPKPAGADTRVSRWPASRVVPSRSATLGRATSCGRRAGAKSLLARTGIDTITG